LLALISGRRWSSVSFSCWVLDPKFLDICSEGHFRLSKIWSLEDRRDNGRALSFEGPSPLLADENHEESPGFLKGFACAIFVIADLGSKT